MKKIIMKLLASCSRRIIAKYKPKVVGISGSVGKTGTKEIISLVLGNKFKVRSSIKNYNNEFGLPLTIIGMESPGKNIFGWLRVFWEAKKLILFTDKEYPEILVLEMGIDREGDMDYLLSIVRPDIGILTNISHSHIEYFGSLEQIKKEKSKLVKNLKKEGVAILNYDNKYLKELSSEIKSKTIFYGIERGADILAKDINFILPKDFLKESFYGINFKIEHQGSVMPINLPKAISNSQVYSALVALATGLHLGLNLVEISEYLRNILPIPGRMNILGGIKNSIIIDDTYNSSPESSLNALRTLEKIDLKNGRKIVVFGDMLELGHYTEEGHQLIGRKMAEIGLDLIFLIGEKSRDIGRGAIEAGFDKDRIFNFSSIDEAREFLKNKIEEGDVLLFKASQGIRLEKLVKEIMSETEKSAELLVRQGSAWEN